MSVFSFHFIHFTGCVLLFHSRCSRVPCDSLSFLFPVQRVLQKHVNLNNTHNTKPESVIVTIPVENNSIVLSGSIVSVVILHFAGSWCDFGTWQIRSPDKYEFRKENYVLTTLYTKPSSEIGIFVRKFFIHQRHSAIDLLSSIAYHLVANKTTFIRISEK